MPGKAGDHVVTRFMRKVAANDIPLDGCWNWIGAVQGNGYGRFNPEGVVTYAHIAAYRLFIGPIPPGSDVCHSCDNRRCVRPDHLFSGTRKVNMDDAASKGRVSRGPRHRAAILASSRKRNTKLTPDDVRLIEDRLRAGHRSAAIAVDFNVTAHTIIAIKGGRIWTHITGRKARP